VAARNQRLKAMGYNAANELTRRHMEKFQREMEES
jgi:serine kinase of HPr protein (carbohydrate metabolism regulator)